MCPGFRTQCILYFIFHCYSLSVSLAHNLIFQGRSPLVARLTYSPQYPRAIEGDRPYKIMLPLIWFTADRGLLLRADGIRPYGRREEVLSAHRKSFAPFGAPAFQNKPATLGGHPFTEAVYFSPFAVVGLKRPFHYPDISQLKYKLVHIASLPVDGRLTKT